ncbi:MAG TPA: membrane protein insertion efficiency factor YidD [Bryobacterales bacterium]|nr:membrane protein insertion efficiency factor YidD [Bryobacterales bacterium]
MKIILAALRCYKRLVSPLLPASCRFYPSCADYARQAVERHGALRGLRLAVWRLLRCQPLSRGGVDPVP